MCIQVRHTGWLAATGRTKSKKVVVPLRPRYGDTRYGDRVTVTVYSIPDPDARRPFRDQRLCRVKGREIGIAAGVFAYSGCENSSRADQALTGLVEMLLRFRRHRSMPSRRISRISEVRSS